MPRILLVDDDPECLLALSNRLRFAFRKHGLKVDTAECAVTGLILAHEYHYDALFVDVVMPGITGLKFVEQLRVAATDARIFTDGGGVREEWTGREAASRR